VTPREAIALAPVALAERRLLAPHKIPDDPESVQVAVNIEAEHLVVLALALAALVFLVVAGYLGALS
jgi:hypothetical protein